MRCVVSSTAPLAALAAVVALAPAARAQDDVPAEVWASPPFDAPPPPAPVARPRLSVAVGMGGTFDAVGFRNGTEAVPAFFATAGVGDGLTGLDVGVLASSAEGRFRTDNPVDRLALDAFGVVRPAARFRPDDNRYRLRVLRALAAELGLGLERDGRSMSSGSRFFLHTGARAELPLTPFASGQPGELRLRVAVRRAIGLYTPTVRLPGANGVTQVGDTAAELYVALLLVF
jgi:hypothetical protein